MLTEVLGIWQRSSGKNPGESQFVSLALYCISLCCWPAYLCTLWSYTLAICFWTSGHYIYYQNHTNHGLGRIVEASSSTMDTLFANGLLQTVMLIQTCTIILVDMNISQSKQNISCLDPGVSLSWGPRGFSDLAYDIVQVVFGLQIILWDRPKRTLGTAWTAGNSPSRSQLFLTKTAWERAQKELKEALRADPSWMGSRRSPFVGCQTGYFLHNVSRTSRTNTVTRFF